VGISREVVVRGFPHSACLATGFMKKVNEDGRLDAGHNSI